jgi:hypothetical protein
MMKRRETARGRREEALGTAERRGGKLMVGMIERVAILTFIVGLVACPQGIQPVQSGATPSVNSSSTIPTAEDTSSPPPMSNLSDASIRRIIRSIDKDTSSFTRSSKELKDESTEGGVLEVLRDRKGEVVRMTIRLFGETGQRELRFYVHDTELIYVRDLHLSYKVPIYDTTHVPGTTEKEELIELLFNRANWSDKHYDFLEKFEHYSRLAKE